MFEATRRRRPFWWVPQELIARDDEGPAGSSRALERPGPQGVVSIRYPEMNARICEACTMSSASNETA